MKHVLVLAASALLLTMLTPEPADAQAGFRRGVNQGAFARRGVAVRRGYVYRGGRRYGAGAAAVGLGVLGAAAVGAAVAAPYGYGYGGYGDPCLRQQQVADAWGNVYWQTVRVC